jgi:hypothetical protein
LSDRNGVFVLPSESLRSLDNLVVSRSGFVFREALLQELSITAKGHTIDLSRRGDEWGTTTVLSSEQAGLIVEAALNLRPEVAIHTGRALPSEGLNAPVCTLTFGEGLDAGTRRHTTVEVGASDVWRGSSVHYARSSATNATFVIERGQLNRLLDLL